jgi:hypothetical protein
MGVNYRWIRRLKLITKLILAATLFLVAAYFLIVAYISAQTVSGEDVASLEISIDRLNSSLKVDGTRSEVREKLKATNEKLLRTLTNLRTHVDANPQRFKEITTELEEIAFDLNR